MGCIWTKAGSYNAVPFASEADLESAILLVRDALFGQNRIYLDVKKRIGLKSGIRNVPDGYLIDLTGSKPRLFVVENELAEHNRPHLELRVFRAHEAALGRRIRRSRDRA